VGERVYLIGLMGSGKSTVGRTLAMQLGRPYVDNDATIAQLAGRSTVALARDGGAVLHQWEARYAQHLRELSLRFVAGVPASAADRPDELRALRESGTLTYLRCDVDTLVRRVRSDAPRPWLTGDIRSIVQRMFDQRDLVLQDHCSATVDATVAPAEVAAAITEHLAAQPRPVPIGAPDSGASPAGR
jgi:shikimate kinase